MYEEKIVLVLCMYMFMYVQMCTCGGQRTVSSAVLEVLSLTWSSPSGLACRPLGSTSFWEQVHSTDMGSRAQTQVLMFARQVKRFTD